MTEALNIGVSGIYQDGLGQRWKVTKIDPAELYPVFASRVGVPGERTFTLTGNVVGDRESVRDLIEEVTPPCPTFNDCLAGQVERCACCDREG